MKHKIAPTGIKPYTFLATRISLEMEPNQTEFYGDIGEIQFLVEFSHLAKAKHVIQIRMYNQVNEEKFDTGNVHTDPISITKSQA